MKVPLLLLSWLAAPLYVHCSVQLVESGPGTVQPGGSLKLTCTVTGDSVKSAYWEWIRQADGKGLEWLGQIDWSSNAWRTYYSSSLQGRITLTADASGNAYSLELRSLTAADTAVYYCARYWSSGFDYWGQGTPVTVTSVPPTAPTLFPLIPSGDALAKRSAEGGKVTIGCLAKDFMPESITFTWNNKNNVTDNTILTTKFPPHLSTLGSYTASSLASVSSTGWDNFDPFYCKADHSAGIKEVKVLRGQYTPPSPLEPQMSLYAPPIKAFFGPYQNATVICRVINLPSQDVTLQWRKEEELLDSGFTLSTVAEGKGFTIQSELVVTKKDWLNSRTFFCEVKHKLFNESLGISKAALCEGEDCSLDVHVETIPPSYADIFLRQTANLTCKISNIPYNQDIKALNVTWTQGSGNTLLKTELGELKDQPNNLGYIEATTTVCATDWNKHEAFNCKVAFPGVLPKPIEKSLKKPSGGLSAPPFVYVLSPPSEQLAMEETATLTCLVEDFYPEEFFVQWLHNDQPVSSEYFTSKPTLKSKLSNRYFAYSMLTISQPHWNSGDSYTCVVGHEALPLSTTQKTVDKNTGKPTTVNVSLVLSDTANTCH